jgi:hypothetical protein
MKLLFVVAVLALVFLWRTRKLMREGGPADPDLFHGRLGQALALAQPYVLANAMRRFHSVSSTFLDETNGKTMGAQLLHYFGLKPTTTDDEVKAHLAQVFEASWYRLDLSDLRAGDDPVAAMAFACARLAFVTRLALLKTWIAPDAGQRVLLLNLQRAQDCFESWDRFGAAFLKGYRQRIRTMRPDAFAGHFDDADVRNWFIQGEAAWQHYDWPGPAAFSPEAAPDTGSPNPIN